MHTWLLLALISAAPDPRAATREALQQGNLAGAIESAEAWSRSDPEALRCYAALLDANGRHKEAAQVRKKLPQGLVATGGAQKGLGPKAFVLASSLALRASASSSAPVLMMLPIGTPLEVLGQEGSFAKVRAPMPVRPVRMIELDPEDAANAKVRELPGPPAEGYVGVAYLGKAAADPAVLAKQAESADPAERATALERLAALKHDRELYARLAAAAFDADRCSIAGYAATMVAGYTDVIGGYGVEAFELFFGCRGDLARAQLIDNPSKKELAAGRAPKDACAVNVDAGRPCSFCPLEYEENSSEARTAEKAAEKAGAAFEERMERLHALYPGGPWLHVRLRRRNEPATPLQAVRINVEYEACGESPTPEDAGFEAFPITLPQVKPGEAIDLWMREPLYLDGVYGLVATASTEEARAAAIQAKGRSGLRERHVPGGRFIGLASPICCCD